VTVGPLAAAALFGALTQWPRPEPSGPAQLPPADRTETGGPEGPAEPVGPAEAGSAGSDDPPLTTTPETVSLGPPAVVVLRGRWTAEDSAVVASVIARALARVPAAGGALLELDGAGAPLRPTSRGIQQYAISATWTLRPTPEAGVLAGGGLGEVVGLGAAPDQARHGAAINAAHRIASTLRASLPAPVTATGSSDIPF